MKMTAMTEKLFERILSKAAVAGVVRSLSIVIFICYSVCVECLSPFGI